MHNIEIKPCLNGFITSIGCQKVVHTSVDSLLIDLGQYLRNPKDFAETFLKEKAINKDYTMEGRATLRGILPPPTPEVARDVFLGSDEHRQQRPI